MGYKSEKTYGIILNWIIMKKGDYSMQRRNWRGWLAGGVLLTALLTGCSVRSVEEMYALPRQSDAYYDLQNAMDQVLPAGASYSGPTSGSNQQAVQLADLDGDGQEEALVFVKTSGERPLKIYLFDRTGSSYENVAVIEGDGSAFDAVEYAQLDDQPGMEIVVGRQLSDQILQSVCAYCYKDGHVVELASASCSEFRVVDLDSDEKKELFVLRMETENRAGVAELYRYRNGVLEREQQASLSNGANQIKRIVSGYVAQGIPAVFVASSYEADTIITDIFALVGNSFRNIATEGQSGLSAQTVRSYQVYATDINSDGIMELPMPVALPSASAEGETFWTIDWYCLGPEGARQVKMTTFHNYAASWYVVLPQSWGGQLSISREKSVSGVSAYSFCRWYGYDREPEEIFIIYAFTGEDRLSLAQEDGRFLLAEKGETAYSAELGSCAWAKKLTQEDLCAMFHFIYQDWNSGET